ncbi:hypothetical protein SAMN06297387_12852 [Streptomyces zhaozhouensis]|uniref:Uncharacterized protein n=1 Tax=Streptomyces zhaozhouensis TaxID=1300267 RepID=A0A286E856_9ACTN|nr:hypothetical protein [Streptomyces zhaozhouensis]SOD67070.1 hypothetical protein SAMN06297387_12852 [Streptomyces zhaozhouensis]
MSDDDRLPAVRRGGPLVPPPQARTPAVPPDTPPAAPASPTPPGRWAALFNGLRPAARSARREAAPPPVATETRPVRETATPPPAPPEPPTVPPAAVASPAPSPGAGSGAAVVAAANGAVGILGDAVRYGQVIAGLTAAGRALSGVGRRVRETYAYVEDCARSVEHQADLAAALDVDADTVGEHRQAATVARAALASSRQLAAQLDELSRAFEQARAAHETDYGPVVQQAQAMTVPMADRRFYRNR